MLVKIMGVETSAVGSSWSKLFKFKEDVASWVQWDMNCKSFGNAVVVLPLGRLALPCYQKNRTFCVM